MLNYILVLKAWLAGGVNRFLKEESGEVNIVATVVLIGIAVILAVIFKDAISNLIKSLLNTISNNATNAVNGP